MPRENPVRRSTPTAHLLLLAVMVATPSWSQSIKTDGNIETEGQLVSTVAAGTPPLVVSSTTMVPNLNAERLGGGLASDFASFFDLLTIFSLLDNPDGPCFNDTHRFVDCGNGTVTDTVTGLIWLKNANCFGTLGYAAANNAAAALFDGSTNDPGGGDCDLTDGSRARDWRLPSIEELERILASTCPVAPKIGGNGPAVPSCYSDSPWALDVQSAGYWSSTTDLNAGWNVGWFGRLDVGLADLSFKTTSLRVWPVRGLWGAPALP